MDDNEAPEFGKNDFADAGKRAEVGSSRRAKRGKVRVMPRKSVRINTCDVFPGAPAQVRLDILQQVRHAHAPPPDLQVQIRL